MADRWVTPLELKEGDMIDFEPILDDFPDPDPVRQYSWKAIAESDYVLVLDVERETDDCVRVGLEGYGSVGLPTNYLIYTVGRVQGHADYQ